MVSRTILAALPAAVPDSEPLAAILAELRGLRADLHLLAAGRRPELAPADAALSDLLRAIHDAVADRVFSAGDLLIHAALPIAAGLHAAILAGIGIANARRLGKALARAEGRNLGGLVVVRVETDSSGILWSVRRV